MKKIALLFFALTSFLAAQTVVVTPTGNVTIDGKDAGTVAKAFTDKINASLVQTALVDALELAAKPSEDTAKALEACRSVIAAVRKIVTDGGTIADVSLIIAPAEQTEKQRQLAELQTMIDDIQAETAKRVAEIQSKIDAINTEASAKTNSKIGKKR